MSNFQLVTTKHFNGIEFDCYKDTQEQDAQDFWATREQIGQALEYAEPRISIANIHNRHNERLDKFSSVINLITPEGGTQPTTIYSFRGLLEICRYSNMPKADAVMDFLYDIADEIRRTGSYNADKVNSETSEEKLTKTIMYAAKMIHEAAGIKGNQLALALDKVAQSYTGQSMLALSGTVLVAPSKTQLLTPTEIGKHFGVSARKVNEILCNNGYQRREGKSYEPLEAGEPYAVMLDVNKNHSGTSIRQLKWESSFLTEIEDLFKGI